MQGMRTGTDTQVVPVILAGGSGTRLWPLSRELYPKQFLKLVGDETLLQQTLARLDGLACAAPVIVCAEDHRFVVAEQCRLAGSLADHRPRARAAQTPPLPSHWPRCAN